MTQGIQWGPAIAVDGKRPEGLKQADTKRMRLKVFDCAERAPLPSCDPLEKWGWDNVEYIKLPADHPHYRQTEAAPIDWRGELEAVHEDGRVVPVTLAPNEHGYSGSVPRVTNECPAEDTNDNWYEDGTDFCRNGKWRIRNVPQPTPQADTKPDLTARMERALKEVAVLLAGIKVDNPQLGDLECVVEARRVAEDALPEPVDPDLIEARNLVECTVHWSPQTDRDLQSGKNDGTPEMKIALAAIKRGLALALAREKEA